MLGTLDRCKVHCSNSLVLRQGTCDELRTVRRRLFQALTLTMCRTSPHSILFIVLHREEEALFENRTHGADRFRASYLDRSECGAMSLSSVVLLAEEDLCVHPPTLGIFHPRLIGDPGEWFA